MTTKEILQKKIVWVTTFSKKYGGTAYGEKTRRVILEMFDVEFKNLETTHIKWRYLRPIEWFLNFKKLKGKRDLWIMSSFSDAAFALCLSKVRGKKMVLIHHIDNSVFSLFLRPFFFFLEQLFYRNLKKIDMIVTVSDYWRSHFLEKGYKNVYKIYNAFDLTEYDISDEEVFEFKKRYKLEKKPIVYIGNCQKPKGVIESYQELKDLDIYLVTSGEKMVDIPALNLNLNHRDYLELLKASSIVVTMSKFKEGWNITAHEAMLLKTPVIGSGKGGMKELLERGKQIICPDFSCLREKVEYLLEHPEIRERIGEDGYNFAKNFTLEKFKKEWLDLVNKII